MNTFTPSTVFLKKQLDYVINKAFEERYPALKGRSFIPVNRSIPAGAETVSAKIWDSFGESKVLNASANDFPMGSVTQSEAHVALKSLGTSFGYNLLDIRHSQMAGTNLDSREASAARLRIETHMDRLAALGDSSHGLNGLLNNSALKREDNFELSEWLPQGKAAKPPIDILNDINKMVSVIAERTHNALLPDTLILPIKHFAHLAQTPFSNNSQVTILQFILNNNPYIKNIDSWVHLKDQCVVYPRTPQALEMYIPLEFEMLPPQARGMRFEVYCHARFGGVQIYTPKACAYGVGL